MNADLGNYRKSYEKGELLLDNVPENPIELFRDWFVEVDTHFDIEEANAMTISTLGLDGYPKSRVVLYFLILNTFAFINYPYKMLLKGF